MTSNSDSGMGRCQEENRAVARQQLIVSAKDPVPTPTENATIFLDIVPLSLERRTRPFSEYADHPLRAVVADANAFSVPITQMNGIWVLPVNL
jgi:hypothetical protein